MNRTNSLLKLVVCMLLAGGGACEKPAPVPLDGDELPERWDNQLKISETWQQENGHWNSPSLRAADPGTRVGLMVSLGGKYSGQSPVGFEARGWATSGEHTPWQKASWTWIEHSQRVGLVDFEHPVFDPQIRIAQKDLKYIHEVTWSLITPAKRQWDKKIDGLSGAQVSQAHQGLDGVFLAAGVNAREVWNARSSDGCAIDGTPRYRMAVHHTAGQPSADGDYAAKIRSTQAYHMDTRGWCDVGYHFLVTYDGSTWEGRPVDYRGAHVGDQNSGNIGVSFVGCFDEDDDPNDPYCILMPPNQPSETMINEGGLLLGVIADHFGIEVNAQNVKGHKDHSGASTSCPGSYLYPRLDDLRDIANGEDVPSGNDDTTTDERGDVKGVVWDLSLAATAGDSDNARITNATITCSCGESVSVSDSNAFWSFSLAPGTYTFTASAPGFDEASASVTVVANTEVWSSFGLQPSNVGTSQPTDAGPNIPDDNDNDNNSASGGDSGVNDNNNDDQYDELDAGEPTEPNTNLSTNDGGVSPNGAGDNQDFVVDNTPLPSAENQDDYDLVLVPANATPESGCGCASQSPTGRTPQMLLLGFLLLVFYRRKLN